MKDKPKRTSILIWDIPPEVKKKFKDTCKQRGSQMRLVVINFMNEYIRRSGY